MPKSLHLLVMANQPLGNAWRLPGVDLSPAGFVQTVKQLAKTSEDAFFDALFFTDAMNFGSQVSWPYKHTEDFEPFTLASVISTVTENIGLIATASSTFQPPFHLARQVLSLDHLSAGRAGWNIVTSYSEETSRNFQRGTVIDHDERYDRAQESLDVVQQLWDSWDDDALVVDTNSGIYTLPEGINIPAHEGKYFAVRGPIGARRSTQGRPVIFQAGSSSRGKQFAAQNADGVFTGQQTLVSAQSFRSDIHHIAHAAGRTTPPKVTPLLAFLIASSDEEAHRLESQLIDTFRFEQQLGWLLEVEIDLRDAPLDEIVPLSAFPESTETHQSSLAYYRNLAQQGALTVREFLYTIVIGVGKKIVGSPELVADLITEWYTNGAADGFVIWPWGVPGQLELFTEHVVPILQSRGIYRREYGGTTLRDHLGLDRPTSSYQKAATP